MTGEIALAVVAGFSFSLIAIAYRSNASRGVPPSFAAVGIGLAGLIGFGIRSFGGADAPGFEAPAVVWIWGAVNGLAQGVSVYLYRQGLNRGPLGPVWCAGNLTFVTPALYAVLRLGDSLSATQAAGMVAAFLCVAVSSFGQGGGAGGGSGAKPSLSRRLIYGGILLALVFLTGLLGVGLKYMEASVGADGVPLNPRFNDCFMLAMYGVLTLCVLGESIRHGRPAMGAGRLVWNGLIAGVGSVGGMALTARVSALPGGVGFAVISVSAVLAGALITSFGFGEKRTPAWYAVLALAAAAVVLFNLAR